MIKPQSPGSKSLTDDPDDTSRLAPPARRTAPRGADWLARSAEIIANRRGLMRLLIALVSGVLAAFAMAPYHLVPLLFIAFTVFIWQLDGAAILKRRWLSFTLTGWAFGTGFFAAGLYWVGNAFFVDAATFGALMPVAIVAMSIGLALFPALIIGLASFLWHRGASRIVLFAFVWSLNEWLRGHLLTGFPWNFACHIWGATLPMLQLTAVFGTYGLSVLTALAAASPAALVDIRSDGKAYIPRRGWLWLAGAALVVVAIYAFGAIRLAGPEVPDVKGVRLRLVQPSVPQRDKMNSDNAARIFAQHIELMQRPGFEHITQFVWPEAAVPVLLAQDQGALTLIGNLLLPGQSLIAGSVRYETASDGRGDRYFNSMFVINDEGAIAATYDKHHLVPFGEYLPLKPILSLIGLRQLVESESGFTPGPGLRTLNVQGAPAMGPLICYEAIFPGAVTEPEKRPAWLLNITDDTWFGLGPGPRQHFENARIRSIEEGLPLIRAANNGISAVIDAKGRVRKELALNVVGVLDSSLPGADLRPPYARIGDIGYLVLMLMLGVVWFVARRFKIAE